METILLSVNPEYVERILAGDKQYEYRKKLANKPVGKIIIYATEPVMQIVGEVRVLNILSCSPSALWEKTKTKAGISRAKYRLYFKGCKTANAYCLGEVKKYEKPKQLADFNIHQPPQSFIYLSDIQINNVKKS